MRFPLSLAVFSLATAVLAQETLTHSHLVSPAGLPKGWTRIETTSGEVSIGLPPHWAELDQPLSHLNPSQQEAYSKEGENRHRDRLSFYFKLQGSTKYTGSGRIMKDTTGKVTLNSWKKAGNIPQAKQVHLQVKELLLPAGPAVLIEMHRSPDMKQAGADILFYAVQKGSAIYELRFKTTPGLISINDVYKMAETLKIR
ncbi:MAG TPA: hypothetical protein VGL56_17605 [Fimbriimonadaceae bacterium]|jgi:hypothetical protein